MAKTKTKLPISFEECCRLQGKDPDFKLNILELTENELATHQAVYDWEIIRNAINGEWKENLISDQQYKYEPYGYLEKDETKETGFGFSHTHYYCTRTFTGVGSRLASFETPEQALHAIRTFDQYFIKVLIQNK